MENYNYMIEYSVKYMIDDEFEYSCPVIAKSIPNALDLVEAYIQKEWPFATTHEILSCEFIRRIDTLLIGGNRD